MQNVVSILCRKPVWVFLFIFLFFLPHSAFSLTSTVDDRVGQWTGSHTRLVWVQDQGSGADTFALGQKLMLYGYDSRDGRGERLLVPGIGNFFKPLFTPDGSHVIVSNRKTRQMYLVEWETGVVKELGSGIAVAAWQDPNPSFLLRKTTTWVYCFSGPQPEYRYGTAQPLYRFPLDKPNKKELIWDKTNMVWNNVQLSRDGTILGGLFPWPDGGILWMKDKRWQRFGRGCWTSVSPDNSKLLWIFDGLHRNVQVHDVIRGENWKVNINGAPGIGGYEVYHPRWSNHPRYFVITGPYEKGEGGNKLEGGGEKVEVYIGRFDSRARRVEDWIKVTNNSRADFYPDLWVAGGEKKTLVEQSAQQENEALSPNWPASRDNLVFVWENMKAANQTDQQSPVGFYQCNIELRGKALHTNHFKVTLAGGWGETGEAGKKIGRALAQSGQASVEFMLTPGQNLKGRIISFGHGDDPRIIMQQENKGLVVGSNLGGRSVAWPKLFAAGKSHHLVLRFDNESLELFKDGKSMGKKKFGVDFGSNMLDNFILGDPTGNWQGVLGNIAVYNRLLSPGEIDQNSRFSLGKEAIKSKVPTLIGEGKLVDMTEIPTPDSIGAYRRALVVNTYSVLKVIEGEYTQDRILVAEWAVLDRQVIKEYSFPAKTERLVLERFDDHPELEGERQLMDIFEPDLEMYYRLPEG